MSQTYSIYLSGPTSGLPYQRMTVWREYTMKSFPPHLQGISPMRAKQYLDVSSNASFESIDFPLSTDRAITGRSRFDILRAAAILVNVLGAMEISIETVMEIAWASDNGIPVICAMEPEGNPHDHAMMRDCLCVRVASLDEAIEAVTAWVSPHEKLNWTRLEQSRMLIEENRLDLTH
ncbi:hypothetical protein [Granulicella arctica]|uniref:hypothetical protein n=1 Tax=Granulicella arctica TaxID=940613 RepID=UPI0021E03B7F|nr:hypothetical protein [Granulicella arctica]